MRNATQVLHNMFKCLLFSWVELCVVSAWFGVWTLEDQAWGERKVLGGAISWVREAIIIIAFVHRLTQTHKEKIEKSKQVLILAYFQALGAPLAALIFLLQVPMLDTHHAQDSNGLCLRLLDVLVSILGLISTVSCLRGVWHLLDGLFLSRNVLVSHLASALPSMLILFLLDLSSSLHNHVQREPRHGEGFLLGSFYLAQTKALFSNQSKVRKHT